MDLIDRKILYALDLNCRQSAAQIGRKVRCSRAVVNYRIKRLREKGVIKRFITSINLGRLGYNTYKVYFKLLEYDEKIKKEFIDFVVSSEYVIHCIKTEGAFDFSIVIATKSIIELDEIISNLKTRFAQIIREYRVSIIVRTSIFGRAKLLLPKTANPYKTENFSSPADIVKIDEKDKRILKEISQDASMGILEIAKRSGLSVDVIKYRLRKLVDDRVIGNFRILFDMGKLGLYHYVFLLNTRNATKADENRLIAWCQQSNKVMYITKRVGFWEYELHAALKDIDDFSQFITLLEKDFSKILNSYETIMHRSVLKLTYFPNL